MNRLHQVALAHTGWTQFMCVSADAGSIYAYAPLLGLIAIVLLLHRRGVGAFVVVATVLSNIRLNDIVAFAIALLVELDCLSSAAEQESQPTRGPAGSGDGSRAWRPTRSATPF